MRGLNAEIDTGWAACQYSGLMDLAGGLAGWGEPARQGFCLGTRVCVLCWVWLRRLLWIEEKDLAEVRLGWGWGKVWHREKGIS